MKNLRQLLLITNLLCAGAPVLAQAFEAKMGSFKMSVCSPSKECLSDQASSAEGSKMRPLHLLTKPVATLTSGKKITQISADSGYIDLSENQLVLYKKSKKGLQEISFDLSNLKRFDMLHGDL